MSDNRFFILLGIVLLSILVLWVVDYGFSKTELVGTGVIATKTHDPSHTDVGIGHV